MKRLLYGLAVLPLFAATASGKPAPLIDKPPVRLVQLTDRQMDKISAGHVEIDSSNTSLTVISIWQRAYLTESTPNTIGCPTCYLLIITPTISVASSFGQPPTPPITPP